VLAASGCRITGASPVSLPVEASSSPLEQNAGGQNGATFVVTCHYELANCRGYAEAHCPQHRMEEITRKNCPRCGGIVPAHPQSDSRVQQPGYRATFYYRCLE
jgi:hypothetical protein